MRRIYPNQAGVGREVAVVMVFVCQWKFFFFFSGSTVSSFLVVVDDDNDATADAVTMVTPTGESTKMAAIETRIFTEGYESNSVGTCCRCRWEI
jgi:hypothetical protein